MLVIQYEYSIEYCIRGCLSCKMKAKICCTLAFLKEKWIYFWSVRLASLVKLQLIFVMNKQNNLDVV